jgi:hypothetical protein
MSTLLDQLEQRANRSPAGDARAIYRAAQAEADALPTRTAEMAVAIDPRFPSQRAGLLAAAAVACLILAAGALIGVRNASESTTGLDTADGAASGDVHFGPVVAPDGFAATTLRVAPNPAVHIMVTAFAGSNPAVENLTVLVSRGERWTADSTVPNDSMTEIIGGRRTRIADHDNWNKGLAIAAWEGDDGTRVTVAGRGVNVDELRAIVASTTIGADGVASVGEIPDAFERSYAGDGTPSILPVTGGGNDTVVLSASDGTERQLTVRSMAGASFAPEAIRWIEPTIAEVVLPNGEVAFRSGTTWFKQLPEGFAVIHTHGIGSDDEVAAFVATIRRLGSDEWAALIDEAEVDSPGPTLSSAVGTAPPPTASSSTTQPPAGVSDGNSLLLTNPDGTTMTIPMVCARFRGGSDGSLCVPSKAAPALVAEVRSIDPASPEAVELRDRLDRLWKAKAFPALVDGQVQSVDLATLSG